MKTTQAGPFRGDPRPPHRRTAYVAGALGKVEINAPRPSRMTPGTYGRDSEAAAIKALRKAGFSCTRSHLSRGAADLVAIREGLTRQIQVKSTGVVGGEFDPTFCNAGVREVRSLPVGAGLTREVHGYAYLHGHVVTISVAADGSTRVTGKEPWRTAVEAAMGRMRS